MTKENTFYNKILQKIDNGSLVLPTLPDVALEAKRIMDDPNASTTQIAQAISTDPALSARMLKVANSALYRGPVEITNLNMAISRLGIELVRNLVISVVMAQMFYTDNRKLSKRMKELWDKSTKVSIKAQMLSKDIPHISSNDALVAGLMHAIGALPILVVAEQEDLLSNSQELDQLIDNLYPKLTVAILQKWDVPQQFIDVAAMHRDIQHDSGNTVNLVDIVHVAYMQTQMESDPSINPTELNQSPAFKKLNVSSGVEVDELDEDDEEYLAILSLFNA